MRTMKYFHLRDLYWLAAMTYSTLFFAAAALNNFTFQSPEQIFYTDFSQNK